MTLRSQEILSHFSKDALGAVLSVPQRASEYKSAYDKPRGLWVSVDGEHDWPSWCASEMPGWMEGVQRYRVHLVDEPRVLRISDVCGMEDFQRAWGRDCGRGWGDKYIDWPLVAEAYHGIIIAPYIWPCRMEMSWYYGWDCASGCIWNADAIARVTEEAREAA